MDNNNILSKLEKLDAILSHINNVRDNCLKLGKYLIKNNREQLGLLLIANSQIHDHSKFFGIEWDNIADRHGNPELIKVTVFHHNHTNMHHPEYWGSIHNMPDVYLAEMVCDWKARSNEFGGDLIDWVTNKATIRFKFTLDDLVGIKIKEFLNIILEKQF